MKRMISMGILIFVLAFVCVTESFAWFGIKSKEEKNAAPAVSQPASPAPKVSPKIEKAKKEAESVQLEAEKAKRALIEKTRKEINNSDWSVELVKLSGKGKKETDSIIFKNNQVSVSSFSKKGFSATNYSLSIQGDGTLVWETMQTSDKSGIAFWRGEIAADMQSMRGILSHQISDKNKEEYSFISAGKKNIPLE